MRFLISCADERQEFSWASYLGCSLVQEVELKFSVETKRQSFRLVISALIAEDSEHLVTLKYKVLCSDRMFEGYFGLTFY